MTDGGPIIDVDNVTRRFGTLDAIRDVTFGIEQGTILGLIGPSGSGKTTMIRMLTGTLAPTAGRISVMGEEPMRFTRRTREELAYMPQLFSLYPDLTAEENVGFIAALFGISPFRQSKTAEAAATAIATRKTTRSELVSSIRVPSSRAPSHHLR